MGVIRESTALTVILVLSLLAAVAAPAAGQAAGQCPGSGDCCAANGTPGCNDSQCCQTICGVDPFCCETEWDGICAEQAMALCKVCGGSCQPSCNKQNVECLEGPAYANRTFVGQLLWNGAPLCTAWIVAAPNIVMTNEHCIEGAANEFDVRFNFECDQCVGGACKVVQDFAVVEILTTNTTLDFALLRVAGNPAASWGQAVIDADPPVQGEGVYEIHHGSGLKKGVDFGNVTNPNFNACVPNQVAVSVIASGGASGSPIFRADSHCAFAICNCGDPCEPGFGVPLSNIMPVAGPVIAAAGGTVAFCGGPPPCPGTGNCFQGNGTPGCENELCCETVCDQLPFCCEDGWDANCAKLAGLICDPCAGATGDCFQANGTPGCDDPDCCASVCQADPACCDTGWDADCAVAAGVLCNACQGATGDCFQDNGTPGCDDLSCCKAVCDKDPFCCDTEWDDACADIAEALCLPSGACCLADGSCEVLNEPGCADAGGEYQGDEVACNPCVPTGACCFDDGSCRVLDAPGCADAGGVYQGDDVACNPCPLPPGACCLIDGTCVFVDLEKCAAIGGDFQGFLEPCVPDLCPQPPGACCFDDGTCQEMPQQACDDAGGLYEGDFTLCEPNPCPPPPCNAEAGSCFEANPTPGCDDLSCCAAVCAANPFCCEVEWDLDCVVQAFALCKAGVPANDSCQNALPLAMGGNQFVNAGASDDGPSPCGLLGSDVWFTWSAGFTGTLLVSTCGQAAYDTVLAMYPAGACPPDVADVLACNDDDPGDCEGNTSQMTVAVVEGQSYLLQVGGFNGAQGLGTVTLAQMVAFCEVAEGGCFAPNGTPGCEDPACCSIVCMIDPFCCNVEWDGVCVDEAVEACPGAPVCPGEGSCFEPHGTPGCEVEACCDLICAEAPDCCFIAWDQTCADAAALACDDGDPCPGLGDCFEGNGTPGCDDEACCDQVCAVDPFCCDQQWDSICADQAEKLCVGGCLGDLDRTGEVDVDDLVLLILDWDCQAPPACVGDLDGNGETDVDDLVMLVLSWGKCG